LELSVPSGLAMSQRQIAALIVVMERRSRLIKLLIAALIVIMAKSKLLKRIAALIVVMERIQKLLLTVALIVDMERKPKLLLPKRIAALTVDMVKRRLIKPKQIAALTVDTAKITPSLLLHQVVARIADMNKNRIFKKLHNIIVQNSKRCKNIFMILFKKSNKSIFSFLWILEFHIG